MVLWGNIRYIRINTLGYNEVCENMAKLKTSVALDDDLLKWIDKEIAKKRFANRTHAIEYALQQLKDKKTV